MWCMLTAAFILLTVSIIFTSYALSQCRPLSSGWDFVLDPSLMHNCVDPDKSWSAAISTSIVFILSDFFFSFIPITFIFKIHIPLREKIVLFVLMGLGLIASIGSIFKAVNSTVLRQSRDNTWDSVTLVIWGFVEEHLAIIAACIPTLKALFERLLRRAGFTISYKGQARSFNFSMEDRTKQSTMQDGMDKLESVSSPGTWLETGNDSHVGYDSEELGLRVYPAKRQ